MILLIMVFNFIVFDTVVKYMCTNLFIILFYTKKLVIKKKKYYKLKAVVKFKRSACYESCIYLFLYELINLISLLKIK